MLSKNSRQGILLSSTDPDLLKQIQLTDFGINILKSLALEKLRRQRILKEYVAVLLIEQ